MLRATLKLISLMLALAALIAFAASADAATKKKRYVKMQWKGYGFLPGYAPYEAARLRKRGYRGSIYGQRYGSSPFTYTNPPLQVYAGYPYGGYYGGYYIGNYYYGAPGFVRGQYNGGSFGPCWTQTPIGPIWNCGR